MLVHFAEMYTTSDNKTKKLYCMQQKLSKIIQVLFASHHFNNQNA